MREALEQSWRKANVLSYLLWPLSLLYRALFSIRSALYSFKVLASYRAPVPVIVVGNLTVGGTGKTPLVIYLVEELRRHGFTPGVISRGYGGVSDDYPLVVNLDTPVTTCGDEPALIARRTNVPMVVGPRRKDSIARLIKDYSVDLIISDDGLQHLAMQRDIEICLQDATSNSSNTFLLPAGPYREPLARLQSVDMIVKHGLPDDSKGEFAMNLLPDEPRAINPSAKQTPFDCGQRIEALAGIGNPHRFFDTCKHLGYQFNQHVFNDHHLFNAEDIDFTDAQVLMTEKDAVKCQSFADDRHWYLPVNAKLSKEFTTVLLDKLAAKAQAL